jgi:formamidopyrimidine-DNA glycosylase
MPELPEIEIVTRALRPKVVGRAIREIRVYRDSLRSPLPFSNPDSWLGLPILDVRRRARHIIIEMAKRKTLIIHFGMTGSLRITDQPTDRRKHDHVAIRLNNGEWLVYEDPRRFGWMGEGTILEAGSDPLELRAIGPEPLSTLFTASYLHSICQKRSTRIKSLLMDNAVVAGVGNIYANESLHRSKIHPLQTARSLSMTECRSLVRSIRTVLREAITVGGTTLKDFRGLHGDEGKFRGRLLAYDREDETCLLCRSDTIRRIVIAGRSSYYCPTCQGIPGATPKNKATNRKQTIIQRRSDKKTGSRKRGSRRFPGDGEAV